MKRETYQTHQSDIDVDTDTHTHTHIPVRRCMKMEASSTTYQHQRVSKCMYFSQYSKRGKVGITTMSS